MIIESWFSTQLFFKDLANVLPLARQACAGIELRKSIQPYAITNGGITTYPTDSELSKSSYDFLKHEIAVAVSEAARSQNVNMDLFEVEIRDLWMNKMLKIGRAHV